MTDATMLLLMKHLPFLERLRAFEGDHITDASLQHLPRICPNLQEFELNGNHHITQQTIISFGQYAHQLAFLELSYCANLPVTIFGALVNCPLESITISFGDSYTECDTHTATETAFDRLRHLALDNGDPTLSLHIITTLRDRTGNLA